MKYVKFLSTDGREVRELPSIYTALEEVKDPLEIFFFSISFNSKHSGWEGYSPDTEERKKEFGWLKHAASLREFIINNS